MLRLTGVCLGWLLSSILYAQEPPKVELLGIYNSATDPPYSIRGFVFNARTGERLFGVNIQVKTQNRDTLVASDENGEYALLLRPLIYTIRVSRVGYEPLTRVVQVLGEARLNLRMKETAQTLEEVIVNSESADQNITGKISGRNSLDIASIRSLPPLAGEVDVLKSLTLLPGVATQGGSRFLIFSPGWGYRPKPHSPGGGYLV